MVLAAATRLKARLDMIYAVQTDANGSRFSSLHATLLPLASIARPIFQQLRGTKAKDRKGKVLPPANISGKTLGHIQVTGVDLHQLCFCFHSCSLIFWAMKSISTILIMLKTTSIQQTRDRHDPVLPMNYLLPMFPIRHTKLPISPSESSRRRSRAVF